MYTKKLMVALRNKLGAFFIWLQQPRSRNDYEQEIEDLKKQVEEQHLKMEDKGVTIPKQVVEPNSLKQEVS